MGRCEDVLRPARWLPVLATGQTMSPPTDRPHEPPRPFPVAWNPGSGDAFVSLSGGNGSVTVYVSCTAQASSGAFTLPPAVTQAIPAVPYLQLSLSNTAKTSKAAGAWSIDAFATSVSQFQTVRVH